MTIRGIFRSIALFCAILLVLLNRVLLAIGLRKRVDGWRHATGYSLRGEESSFVLAVFGLQAASDTSSASLPMQELEAHIRARLDAFLQTRREMWIEVRPGKLRDTAVPSDAPSYSLRFEPMAASASRFAQPTLWADTASHRTLLRFVCRLNENGEADFWVLVNHVGTDGLPVQTMLNDLKTQWGVREVVYPTPEEFEPLEQPIPVAGRAGIVEVRAVIDFTPLLDWRREQNKNLPQPMTFAAAFLWCISRHPRFHNIFMGSTVEVPTLDGLASGVGLVVVRPEDYWQRSNGLAEYAKDFNRRMELTRKRQSSGAKTLDAAAYVPDRLTSIVLRAALQGKRAFGTLGLTVLKDAEVFGAPIGEVGHEDGFVAIGSVGLTARGGQKVGFISVKGPSKSVKEYPRLIREAIADLPLRNAPGALSSAG